MQLTYNIITVLECKLELSLKTQPRGGLKPGDYSISESKHTELVLRFNLQQHRATSNVARFIN
jgi:hypothetical protein